jgi:hypothetical protein
VACATIVLVGGPLAARPQTELDRIVSKVNNRIITQSDIRQARQLKLVDDPSSDDSTQKCLEDRLLILSEIARSTPLPASPVSDLSARREQWERSVGGMSAVSGLLAQVAMSETALQTWLRDDVRIQMHLTRQFGGVPDADRAKATADWIARLRQRAGLK